MKKNKKIERSPIHKFWISDQKDKDVRERLSIVNKKNRGINLFIDEPYKWEILYQSVLDEVVKGDVSALKGFNMLINMINDKQKTDLIDRLRSNNLINEQALEILNQNRFVDYETKKPIRFVKILFKIFTNPYNIELKGKKKTTYEKTGYLILLLKKFIRVAK